jgi:glycolate oxidase FAD binding subunit
MAVTEQAPLLAGLGVIVGEPNARPGSGAWAVDGRVPAAVVSPRTDEEAAAVLRHADDSRLAVIPLGARMHAGLGNAPSRYDIALDLGRLNRVVEFEPADLTITCQAGLTLGELRRITAASAMMVPFEPALPDGATVGGVLAANAWGPARMQLGAARDFTIGMKVVTADGRITRAGGKVVKNVAGYDLCKLYIGSLGTLVVIVEASFKALPLPPSEASLSFRMADCDAACRVANDAFRRGLSTRSAVITADQRGWRLDASLAGSHAGVERSAKELQALAASMPVEAPPAARVDAPFLARVSVLPDRLSPFIARITAIEDVSLEAYPVLGTCRLSFAIPATIEAVQAIAREFSGSCVLERCPAEVKQRLDVFGDAPPGVSLMRSIKREFDPNGVLSPGRMVGRI